MQPNQASYLDTITKQLEKDGVLGKVILNQWRLIVEFAIESESLTLDKTQLLAKTERSLGNVTPANFRKRISMLNQEFKDNDFGIELNNTKYNINVVIDDQKLNENLSQQTAEFIKKSNKHNEIDDDKFIAPQASKQLSTCKRQVLFSYSWEPNEDELNAQRQFAEMLEQGLKFPPAKYKDSPRVSLFIDHKNFELGEDQSDQQDRMCQETPIAVICYTHKYIHSLACQREIDYYLTKEGNNLPNRRAIILPFDCGYGDMEARFKKNLALTVPARFTNGLDFFTQAPPAQKKELIGQLVANIYAWFDSHPHPPKLDKHHSLKQTLQETNKKIDLSSPHPEHLKGNTQQHHYEGAVNIVEHIFDWATGTTGAETRLFYLLGDFGAGKSTSCQMLTQKLMTNYQKQRQHNPSSKPVMPIYLDLKKLLNAFDDQRNITTQAIPTLLEVMLGSTGVESNVSGQSIIQFINEYPCLLIFDGFDEVGQKLTTQQQTGLLNKLIDIFPKSLYQQDLERLRVYDKMQDSPQPNADSPQPNADSPQLNADTPSSSHHSIPINSRILLSCRTHFFKTQTQQEAFHQLYYRHEAGVSSGEVKNYQTYYLLPFTKEQIENYLTNWLGQDNAKKALSFIDNVHDLSGLSQRPLMLNLIRDLLPQLQEEFKHNPHINASTLYKLLFDKVGYRDNEKHIIPLDEKRKLLGRFALYLWQQGVTTLHVEALDNWLLEHRQDYPQLNIKLTSGQYDPEIILQDLHNASLLIRDNDDEYRFAHTSFFEFFVAVGMFDSVACCTNTTQGFDYLFHDIDGKNNLSHEIIQFLIDWRVASRQVEQKQFDAHWQKLQQANSSVTARQMAFNIWYFAYRKQQPFTQMSKPNWQGLTLSELKLDKQTQETMLDLSGADLAQATVEECDFSFVDLTEADFSEAHLRQNNFASCDFTGVSCEQAKFYGNRFNHCQSIGEIEKSDKPNVWHSNLILPAVMKPIQAESSKQQLLCETVTSQSVAFHPYKPQYLLAGNNGATLWEMQKDGLKCIQHFANEKQLSSCQFSPDGKQILLGGVDGVSLWSLEKVFYQCTQRFSNMEYVLSCEFSPDGSRILIAGLTGVYIWHYSKDNFKCILCLKDEKRTLSGKFSPNGEEFLLAGIDGASIWTIVADKPRCINRWGGEKNIRDCQFSPDGKKLLFAGIDGLSIWSLKEGSFECIQKSSNIRYIYSCQFTPDGKKILLGSIDGAGIWEFLEKDLICSYYFKKTYDIQDCQIHLNSKEIFLVGHDNTSIWKSHNKSFKCTHRFLSVRRIRSCQVSQDGEKILSFFCGMLKIFDFTQNEFRFIDPLIDDMYITSYCLSSDDKSILLTSVDGASLWRIQGNKAECVQRFRDQKSVQNCYLSLDGKKLLLAGYNKFSLWSLSGNDFRCTHSLEKEYHYIENCQISPDNQKILMTELSGTVSVWCMKNDSFVCVHRFESEEHVKCCQFTPNGQKVLLVGYEGISFWSIEDNSFECVYRSVDENRIETCQFNQNGDQIILGGYDGVSIWNIKDNEFECILRFAEDKIVSNVSWHYQTNTVAVTVFDEIHVYQLEDNKATLISVLQQFDQTAISYMDSSKTQVTDIQGDAWKYLYNKVTLQNGEIKILPPDTHPDWNKAYHGS